MFSSHIFFDTVYGDNTWNAGNKSDKQEILAMLVTNLRNRKFVTYVLGIGTTDSTPNCVVFFFALFTSW